MSAEFEEQSLKITKYCTEGEGCVFFLIIVFKNDVQWSRLSLFVSKNLIVENVFKN